jgi:hypothetical protein
MKRERKPKIIPDFTYAPRIVVLNMRQGRDVKKEGVKAAANARREQSFLAYIDPMCNYDTANVIREMINNPSPRYYHAIGIDDPCNPIPRIFGGGKEISY